MFIVVQFVEVIVIMDTTKIVIIQHILIVLHAIHIANIVPKDTQLHVRIANLVTF